MINPRSEQIYLASTIDALGIGEDQFELLSKLGEAAAGISGGGDEDLGVTLPGMCILIVDVSARHCCVVILKLHLPPEGLLLFPQLVGDGLALCEGKSFGIRVLYTEVRQAKLELVSARLEHAPCLVAMIEQDEDVSTL